MTNIEYEIIGASNFLRAAEYSHHIPNFLREFKDKFKLAESVIIHFEENINPNPNIFNENELTVSEDGLSINLVYKTGRYFQSKGGGLSKPSEQSFFQGLKYYIENHIINEDNERFDQLLNNKEEE